MQHGADVKSRDYVSYCRQLFYFLVIMVQVCVVPNNLCFGLHLSGELSCVLVKVLGQVHCLSKYRYIRFIGRISDELDVLCNKC